MPDLPSTTPQRPSPALAFFLGTGLLGLIAALIMLLAEGSLGAALGGSPNLQPIRNWQAPQFQLQTLDGRTVSLAELRGRPVFLNFWRTDCVPCVRELPAFQTFVQQQGEDGAVVLALNQGETPADIIPFLNSIGINAITVLLDEEGLWGGTYGIIGYPTTFVIDAAGMVRYRKIGEMELDEMYNYLEALADDAESAQG